MANPTRLMRAGMAFCPGGPRIANRNICRATQQVHLRQLAIGYHKQQPQQRVAALHTQPARFRGRRAVGRDGEPIPDTPPPTDFESMDVLGETPAPATSVEACLPDGFKLGGGVFISDGAGALLVGGEAFSWRPWLSGGSTGTASRLVNAKGQWEVPDEAFGLLSLTWPRPDLLILGLGPEMRPLSPATRRCISSLGLRVEVLDTRNAASQFNLLATERGVGDVAAALIPIGWKEGIGAKR